MLSNANNVNKVLELSFFVEQVNDTTVENVTHAEAVDALKKAGNTVRLVSITYLRDNVYCS